MKVAMGNDHGAVEYKDAIKAMPLILNLTENRWQIIWGSTGVCCHMS